MRIAAEEAILIEDSAELVEGDNMAMRRRAIQPGVSLSRADGSASIPKRGRKPAKPQEADEMANWTASERERQQKVKAGETVIANLKSDKKLIAWAQKEGRYVFIGRPSAWGNPFVLGKHGDRPTCIENFKTYFDQKPDLQERLGELRGKVLGCYCHPEPCHGGVLLQCVEGHAGEIAHEHHAPR